MRVDRNVHALCSFTAYALPQLRALGWRVELPGDYPFQVVGDDAPWYAHVGATTTQPDWFSLELGIEVGGPAREFAAGAARSAGSRSRRRRASIG